MSSYLEKYHLQKVQPVKNRTQGDLYKARPKHEKTTSMKIPFKQKTPLKRNYFQRQQNKPSLQFPKTEQLIKNRNTYSNEHQKKKEFFYRTKHQGLDDDKITSISQQSLSFKSAKDNSTGNKIIRTVQQFFTKIIRSDNGCGCGNPCPHAQFFFQWVGVSYGTVKHHYLEMLHQYQESMKNTENQSSNCSIQDSMPLKKSISLYEQLRKNTIQIQKDVDRTQSQSVTFQNKQFKDKIKNILMCYSYEDPEIGYIQGMNLILSGILYHVKDQVKSYAVFRKLIFTIRTIYFDAFMECYQHINKIKKYLKVYVNDLYELFNELGVDLNIVCLPWVLSLLTCVVPLQHLHLVYTGFIEGSWKFFYKTCLAIMIYHKDNLLELYDSGDVLILFSATNDKKGEYDWEDIIKYGKSITL